MLILFIIDWFTYHSTTIQTSLNPNSIIWGHLSGQYYSSYGNITYNMFNLGANNWYEISIYTIVNVTYVFSKVLMIMLLLQVFLKTTSDLELTNGFNLLFKPLNYLKIPTKALSLILSLTLRFIPKLYDEIKQIRLAQKSRGSHISKKNKLKSYINLIIPLFILAFESADKTSDAMIIKKYNFKNQKYYFYKYKFHYYDYLFFLLSIGLCCFIFYMLAANIFFGPFGIAESIVKNGI